MISRISEIGDRVSFRISGRTFQGWCCSGGARVLVFDMVPVRAEPRYNFTDGWAPLAHFLGKPIPDVEFPQVDLPGLIFEA